MNVSLVSVVIPAFNAARTLAGCLKSVQSQTFKDFEAVIIDDGSTDETVAIARDFCAKDPRFKLIAQANEGCSVARRAGIELRVLGSRNWPWHLRRWLPRIRGAAKPACAAARICASA